jgi:hypothetical protein
MIDESGSAIGADAGSRRTQVDAIELAGAVATVTRLDARPCVLVLVRGGQPSPFLAPFWHHRTQNPRRARGGLDRSQRTVKLGFSCDYAELDNTAGQPESRDNKRHRLPKPRVGRSSRPGVTSSFWRKYAKRKSVAGELSLLARLFWQHALRFQSPKYAVQGGQE